MKRALTIAVLLVGLTSSGVWAAETVKTKAKAKPTKPAAMSTEKRRDLERRIEALEHKNEMQYRETDGQNGAPGAAAPAPQPATH
jgi:hypothetical protein